MSSQASAEIAAQAARLVVEEGLDYAAAKRKAARDLGRRQGRSAEMPSNEAVEDEVWDYLRLFCADTQAQELQHLRFLAAKWMERLADFRPHLGGAVWRGTATKLSPILIDLYVDDPKAAEIAFLNAGVEVDSHGGEADDGLGVLTVAEFSRALNDTVTLHFIVHDHDELRGALKPDSRGRSWRGDLPALRRLMNSPDTAS
ncbi:MAG: hypothetical protein C4K60_10490 [Ideonella sp. MAG2]|nr:MAG: hypothetical protein C4K60_10490 [Ideonella sp. MAG2]